MVPILVYLAANNYPKSFLILAVITLSTDAIDGYLARKLNQITNLGTTLDSVGDMMMYFTMPFCGWLLWPNMIMKEIIFITVVMIAFFIPMIAGLLKFGRMPSYHTWLAKTSTIFISIATLIWFTWKYPFLFRFAVLIQVLVMIEYVAITLRLKEWRGNIPSYWHLDN
jgi:CDP-diacylglycerol--glycerol-3-phosphate 3-phosphatidyltransferase